MRIILIAALLLLPIPAVAAATQHPVTGKKLHNAMPVHHPVTGKRLHPVTGKKLHNAEKPKS
jgi:hypothetical protein